jgi:hypothetical protein
MGKFPNYPNEMNDGVATLQGRGQGVGLGDIAVNNLDGLRAHQFFLGAGAQ